MLLKSYLYTKVGGTVKNCVRGEKQCFLILILKIFPIDEH